MIGRGRGNDGLLCWDLFKQTERWVSAIEA